MPSGIAQFRERDALQTKRDGEFTAMMQVVGHGAPQNPLARQGKIFPLVGKREGLREVRYRPAVKIILDHLPVYILSRENELEPYILWLV